MAYTDPDSGPAVTGTVAPAALWNTYVRDNMKAAARQWLSGVAVVGAGGGFGARWFPAAALLNGSLVTSSVSVGSFVAIPWVASRTGTLDRIQFSVNTGGAAGSVARAGLYRATSDTDPYPGPLVVDGGEFVTTTTGFKTATISAAITAATLYYAVLLVGANAPTLDAWSTSNVLPLLGGDGSLSSQKMFRRTQTYGALPGTFPSGPPTSYDGINMPGIEVRWSA